MRRVLAAKSLGLVAALGCASADDLFVEQEWPNEHTALVVVLDDDGNPIAPPRFYAPNTSIETAFERRHPFRIFVRTYGSEQRAPNGQPLDACEVHMGEGLDLPAPSTAWRTSLIQSDAVGAVAFAAERLDTLTTLDVRFVNCEPIDTGCDGYAVETIDLPEGLVPQVVATVNDDVVMIGGDVHPGPDAATMFARLAGGEVTILPPDPSLTGTVSHLDYGGADTFVGLIHRSNKVVVVDAQGRNHPLSSDLRMTSVAAGRDGTMLAFDETRTVELLENGRVIVERTDVPFGLKGIDVHSASRILVRTQKTLYAFDGRVWAEEWEVPLLEEISDLAIDDDMMALVGNLEHARVRHPTTGEWIRLPYNLDAGRRLRSVAPLGGGRFVTVGDAGYVAAWNGISWCDISLADLREPIRWVSASPSRRLAYAFYKDTTSGKLIRISAPSPAFP